MCRKVTMSVLYYKMIGVNQHELNCFCRILKLILLQPIKKLNSPHRKVKIAVQFFIISSADYKINSADYTISSAVFTISSADLRKQCGGIDFSER